MPPSSPAAPTSDTDRLAELRSRIDQIDEQMHGLLIERSNIIDALVEAKGTQNSGGTQSAGPDSPSDAPTGAAFRPLREADMMRRLVERHEGSLPMVTVEHIWREIISTFTRLQADYVVHLDGSADAIDMRDAARFYFGFALDLVTEEDPDAVVAAVAASTTDLGVIALTRAAETPWWRALGGSGPHILARLPFLLETGRPADMPALVLSPPVSEPGDPDISVYCVTWMAGKRPDNALAQAGIEILARHTSEGTDALIAVPGDVTIDAIAAILQDAGAEPGPLREVGGYAAAIDLDDSDDDDF
ncbi:chorismate mutase [Breoghania corrubedonensis]|uniref:chorismate mutase n=1 Tax=Breoghania corrubedonensis TaxID=665038 RepID=A0A2T5VAU1_9HYPH|nr:chorismate mutase [Breoghania corrubedonensis]PTW60868.1 chorismate mutase [Breoghania corrubedonensis]